MRRLSNIVMMSVLAALLVTVSSNASFYEDNGYTQITIHDNDPNETSGWYGPQEDNEVHPGAATGQHWDLEGYYQKEDSVVMIGGWDFRNGYGSGDYLSGDIFIDVDGLGTGPNEYGYEYAIDVNWPSLAYSIVKLDSDSVIQEILSTGFNSSDPWNYLSGGELTGYGGVLDYETGLSDAYTGFSGNGATNSHNAVGIDLSFLGAMEPGTEFTIHFTQSCGNDNLMGHGSTAPVPEPATMILFGSGLLGLAGVGRKNLKKKEA